MSSDMVDVIGRLAPTPSGRMHLGNIMAMMAAWMSARSQGGRVLLRIEDLDRAHVVRDADRWIMDDLEWLGIDWDADPVYQSDRDGLYGKALKAVESADSGVDPGVYPCWCSRSDIRAASAPQEGDGFVVYPGTCRRLAMEHPDEVRARLRTRAQHSLRLAMPGSMPPTTPDATPDATSDATSGAMPGCVDPPRDVVDVHDRVFGDVRYSLSRDVGDSVIRRADGVFSYQLAVVVDDLTMGVTDVVRGRDLLRSTALQMEIRRRLEAAFYAGADIGGPVTDGAPAWNPRYAHLPLVDGSGGRRLAKRERSLDMGALRAAGATPDQVVGYCAWLLGIRAEGTSDRPVPLSCAQACRLFSWKDVAASLDDRMLPKDVVEVIRHL